MALSSEQRRTQLFEAPSSADEDFIWSLSGDRRAVLATDPTDCSPIARQTRISLAKGERPSGWAVGTAQEVGGSIATGIADHFFPGAARALDVASTLQGLNKIRVAVTEYRDVCDLIPAERAALLTGTEDSNTDTDTAAAKARQQDESFMQKAGRLFGR